MRVIIRDTDDNKIIKCLELSEEQEKLLKFLADNNLLYDWVNIEEFKMPFFEML